MKDQMTSQLTEQAMCQDGDGIDLEQRWRQKQRRLPRRKATQSESSRCCSISPHPHDVTDWDFDDDAGPSSYELSSTNKQFEPTYSSAKQEWIDRKTRGSETNTILDELMEYEGLEQVKQQFLDIKSKIDISKEQGRQLSSERFNIVFQGNPGTESLGALQVEDWAHETTSGMEVVNEGPGEIARKIDRMFKFGKDGGILIIDEAYQLVSPQAGLVGRSALDIILTMMEKNVGKLAIVFLGYKDEMESFFEHNPGLSSRIPYTMEFNDLTNYELLKILSKQVADRYDGRMEVEGGMAGLYMRCAIRRLAAGRGMKGFGNARAIHNLLNHVMTRQGRRLVKERREDGKPNSYLLTKEDLLGPDPSTAQRTSQAWAELQDLVGLEQVKESVKCLIDTISINYNRELHELRPIAFSLNQIFIGNPVVLKTPADFIGDSLGKSEVQTKRILEASLGKVLVVDEAYMLDPGNINGGQNEFKSGVIDTFVSVVQGLPCEDRCIIFVGYEDRMRAMFRNANSGLSRRFPIEQPFRFKSFTSEQLLAILQSKMNDQHLFYTNEALTAANEIFNKELMRGNHTNAGIVDRVLETAKSNYLRRILKLPINPDNPNPRFQGTDFNPDSPKITQAEYQQVMQGRIDDTIINQLMSYRNRYRKARERGRNPEKLGIIPTRFIIHGPPGTGKTTTSHLMAELFFELGYLSLPEVVEYSATDLIGQYVGHTSHKTREKLKDGLGRLIYIKNAHRLLSGLYETQAVDELTQFLSQPAHQRSTIVILGSDTEGLGQLMKRSSLFDLFSEEIAFKNIPSAACMALLTRELECHGLGAEFSFLSDSSSPEYEQAKKLFFDMQSMPGWANAHDVRHIARQITGRFFELDGTDALQSKTQLSILVIGCMDKVIKQKKARVGKSGSRSYSSSQQERQSSWDVEGKASSFTELNKYRRDADIKVDTNQMTRGSPSRNERATAEAPLQRTKTMHPQTHHEQRQNKVDKVVTATHKESVADDVWNQLQEAKKAASKKRADFEELERRRQEAANEMLREEGPESDQLRKEYEAINKEYMVARPLIRQEEKIQYALRKLGRCPVGFEWTHVSGGYRCEAGVCFVSDAEVRDMVDTSE
ncbi:hypothetical protein FHL15_005429 [Xylaria flabelliformis]|uniref:AAA+ ATPase domain-containing protein n=1 Tax=Xylaria flabelliformis TaxID=2512241 RepID=A0A553I0M1_9PEZI|nr:hypothetical protein FHL15_005429 [Xylaria flabelliformis]